MYCPPLAETCKHVALWSHPRSVISQAHRRCFPSVSKVKAVTQCNGIMWHGVTGIVFWPVVIGDSVHLMIRTTSDNILWMHISRRFLQQLFSQQLIIQFLLCFTLKGVPVHRDIHFGCVHRCKICAYHMVRTGDALQSLKQGERSFSAWSKVTL